jgi:hypothetical protein
MAKNRLRLGIAGGVVLLLVIVYFASGPFISDMEAKSQTRALHTTGTDLTKIDAFFSNTTIRDANKTDAHSLKLALDVYATKLTDTDSTLAADQDRLDQINRDIDFYSIVTPFQSGKVHTNDSVIRRAKLALNAVAKATAIFRTQVAFEEAWAAADAGYDSAVKAAKNEDITSASDFLQTAVTLLNQCQLLMKDADVPPQFRPAVDAETKVMKDVAGFVDTARANDLPGAVAYLRQLLADSTVVYFDQTAYLNWYSEKFNPILKDYRSNASAVPGFAVTTTKLV